MAQLTYTTLEGDVLDLTALTDAERAFLDSMIDKYRAGTPWGDFARCVSGDGNPVLEPGRRIGHTVRDHPLYRAISDMEDRLAIAQGVLRPGIRDDPAIEPFGDDFLGVYKAASELGITAKAAYKAIERGDLVATKERPARVSRRSIERFKVSSRHVKAGRARLPIDPTKVRDRDATEFNRLLDATIDRVYPVAASLLGVEAEDAVQEVYLQAWQNAGDLPESLTAEDWILARAGAFFQGLLRAQGKLAVDPIAPYLEMIEEMREQLGNGAAAEPAVPDPKGRERIRESILASVA